MQSMPIVFYDDENAPRIFTGRANEEFGRKISSHLNLKQGEVDIKNFKDGEIWVKYSENIRGRDVYIVQPTNPPADNILELLIMIDAARRSSAKKITAVLPYFGYARQDRKDQPRVSITAKLLANLITVAGADRIITMDLHTPQIQGFFDIPFDHLYGSIVFTPLFTENNNNLVVVSPDLGGIKIARSYAKRLNAGLVVIDKRRPEANVSEVMNIIGDVEGKDVLIVDDLIDTGGTFVSCVEALHRRGANKIVGAVTHALLSGKAIQIIENSFIDKLYVTDTIKNELNNVSKIEVVSATELFAKAIYRCNKNESISNLFEIDKG